LSERLRGKVLRFIDDKAAESGSLYFLPATDEVDAYQHSHMAAVLSFSASIFIYE
jgi:hypothetical protein